MNYEATFDDGRGRFPDRIAVSVPRGLRNAIKDAAGRQNMRASEFVRQAIVSAIKTPGDRKKRAHG